MTMHLARGFSTLKTNRKLKPKLTDANIKKWTQEMHAHNKRQKQMGLPKLTFEEYVNYIHGRPAKSVKSSFSEYSSVANPSYRSTPNYPSRDTGCGVAGKKENMRYTGTLVKGIATMHKSNAVPIIDDQEAKDISRMRR